MNVQVPYSIVTEEGELRVLHGLRIDGHASCRSFHLKQIKHRQIEIKDGFLQLKIALLFLIDLSFKIGFCCVSLTGWWCVPQADFRLDRSSCPPLVC